MDHETAAAASPQHPPRPAAGGTVPLSHYREAVQQYFDCAPSDFELAAWQAQGPCHVRLGGQVYRVDSTPDLTTRAKWLLTDCGGAAMFPLTWAPVLLAGVHREQAFSLYLRREFAPNPHKLAQLQTVMATTQRAGNDSETFWDTLYLADGARLYPTAIVAASQVRDTARLLAEVAGRLADNSDESLIILQGRLLGTLVLNEAPAANPSPAELAQEEAFYFYLVDDACWEENQVIAF